MLSLRDALSLTSVVIPKLLHAHTSIRAMPPQSGRGFVLSPEAHARPVLLAATEEEMERMMIMMIAMKMMRMAMIMIMVMMVMMVERMMVRTKA